MPEREMVKRRLTYVKILTSKKDYWSSKSNECSWVNLGSDGRGQLRRERNPLDVPR